MDEKKTKRKFKITTNSKHYYPIYPNPVDQDFSAPAKDKLWTYEISYIHTRQG